MNESKLTEVIGKGEYDLFHWSWTPFVDPDFMLSVFQCNQIAQDPADPTNYYNDANWCDPEYDKLYEQQKVELDPAKRRELVHEMLTRFYRSAVYVQPRPEPGSRGVPHGSLRGLAPPARRGRAGDLHEHLADLLQPDADRGWRRSDSGMSTAAIGALAIAGAARARGARVRADAPPHGRGARVELAARG